MLFLCIDVGTTCSKVQVFDEKVVKEIKNEETIKTSVIINRGGRV